jgi:glucose/arabinose dehydrogenase
MNGNEVVSQEVLFEELGSRFRDVRTGPDGNLYLLTDAAAGKILKVVPAQ